MFRRSLVLFLRASDIGKEQFRLVAPALLALSLLLEAAPGFPGRGLLQGLLSLAIPAFYAAEDLEKALRSPSPLRHVRKRWLDLLVLASVGLFGIERASLLIRPGALGAPAALPRLALYGTIFYTAALLKLVTRARRAVDFLARLDLRPSQTIAVSFLGTMLGAGVEVIAVDTDPNMVEAVKNRVTHLAQLDSTDLNALKAVGADGVDAAVVAMGEDFQASVLTTAALKELGVKHIVARAKTEREARILRLAGANQVLFVEQEMGQRLGKALVGDSVLDHIALAEGYAMIQWAIDEQLAGKALGEVQLRTRYRVNVVAIKKREVTKAEDGSEQVREQLDPVPLPEYRFAPGDILVLVGKESDLKALTGA